MILMLLALVLALSAFAVPAMAAEERYTITMNIVTKFSDMPEEDFVVYFRNVETNEQIKFVLSGVHHNEFFTANYTPGTYTLEKCAWAGNEEYIYEVVSKPEDLVILTDSYTFYTFRIGEHGTYIGSDPNFAPVREHKFEMEINTALILSVIPVLLFLLIWAIVAIQGRRNFYKRVVAQFLKHLFIAFAGLMFGLALSSSIELPPMITVLFCLCFPFGFVGVGMFMGNYIEAPSDEDIRAMSMAREFRSDDENATVNTIGCFLWAILILFCGIIGVVALPVTLIRDIRTIIKCRPLNFRYR